MKRYGKALGMRDEDDIMAYWSDQWDSHLEAVQSFFSDKPGRLLVYDIKQDKPQKLCDFLAPDFLTDPGNFRHEGDTEKVDKASYASNRAVPAKGA